MKISIRNLGPLEDAELELGDITVLLGPPNAGKSYTLKSVYTQIIPLDAVARERLFVKTVRELELLDHIETFIRRMVPRCLMTIMTVYDYINQDNLNEILRLLRKKFGLDEISITEESDGLMITLKVTESVDIGVMVDMFRENLVSLTQEILPLRTDTKIEIPELSVPELKTFFIEVLRTPHTWETRSSDEKLGTSSVLHVSSEMGPNQNFDIAISVETKIPFDSLLWEQFWQYVERRLPLNRKDRDVNSIEEMVDTIIKNYSRLHLPLELSLRSMFGKLFRAEMNFVRYLTKEIGEILKNAYEDALSLNSVLIVPFGRSPFVYQLDSIANEPYLWERFIAIYRNNIVFYSYLHHLVRGRRRILENEFNEKLVEFFNPVLQGKLTFDTTVKKLRYQKWGSKDVPITLASALAGEIAGILLPILDVSPGSYVIIEEPEAQLHYSAQIMMALTLAALSTTFNHRIIFSTHSDILAITLAYLKELDYTKEDISTLISRLLEAQGIALESNRIKVLAEAVSKAKELDIRFYYYEPKTDGTVRVIERSSRDILMEVPGITMVTDILASWAINL